MSGADKARSGEPSEVELLLPWYAAGTLDPAAMREIEAAIAGDPELADRYEWARAEFAQETAIGDGAGAPSPNDVRTLFAKIDALPARRSQSTFNLGDRPAGRRTRRHRHPRQGAGKLSERFGAFGDARQRQLRPDPFCAGRHRRRYFDIPR